MHNIAEHDAEEEREGDTGKDGRVGFLVVGDAVSVDDLLENRCKLSGPEHSRYSKLLVLLAHLYVDVDAAILHLCHVAKEFLLPVQRHPDEPDREGGPLLGHVEGAVNCFFSSHKLLVDRDERILL